MPDRPVPINSVLAETTEEKELFALGEQHSNQRKKRSRTSLIKYTPNDLESDLIHAYWQHQIQFHGTYIPCSYVSYPR
jgi:acyl-coenzyme A thioesterase 9